MLSKLAAKEPEQYAKFWGEFGQVLKEGVIEDHTNKDKLSKLLRFSTSKSGGSSQDQSLDDYIERAGPKQDKIYYILADNLATATASPHLERFVEKEIEVLLLTERIDPWFADSLTEYAGKSFQDVGRANVDMPDGDGKITQDTMNDEHKPLLKKIRNVLKDRIAAVNVSQRLVDSPACVVASQDDMGPQVRRMLEASGQAVPETKPILEVNIDHPLVTRLSAESDEARFSALSEIVLDHALLAEGSQLDNPAEYVRRMNNLLLELDSKPGSG
jgi:molecular chaperone HtpG